MQIPASISFAEASIITFCLMTAACGLFVAMNLSIHAIERADGQKPFILIWGANGSVGSLAIQVAKIAKYGVIAVTSTTDGISQAKKLGADLASSKDDPLLISSVTGASIAPMAALDRAVSSDTITNIIQCVGPGRIVTTQKYDAKAPFDANLAAIYAGEMFGKTLKGEVSHRGLEVSRWLWDNLYGWLQSGQIAPLKHNVIGGLSEVERGLERMSKGNANTKLVVIV